MPLRHDSDDVSESDSSIACNKRPICLLCLVDSGSGSTVMSTKLAKRLGLKVRPCTDDQPLFSASGAQLKVMGITDATFCLNGLRIPHTVKVIDGLFPNLVIGVEFMQANRMSVNYADGTVRFYDDLIVIPLQYMTVEITVQ